MATSRTRTLLAALALVAGATATAVGSAGAPGAGGTPATQGGTDVDPDRPASPFWVERVLAEADIVRELQFPVLLGAEFADTFGACRGESCERSHRGNDLFAPKLRPLVAARSGTVTWLRTDAAGTAGNGVGITDADGWRYLYLHVNDDSPGSDDGANPATWRFGPGIELGAEVEAGQLIGYLGDSGNAESTPPHLHFELRTPYGFDIDPFPSLVAAVAAGP
jgi:murein DD-endopeptidase MepM/ murein hydrolase activator NlpD